MKNGREKILCALLSVSCLCACLPVTASTESAETAVIRTMMRQNHFKGFQVKKAGIMNSKSISTIRIYENRRTRKQYQRFCGFVKRGCPRKIIYS